MEDLNQPAALLTAFARALAAEGPAVRLAAGGNRFIEAPEGVAVVVGTSGSTGQPKQVMLSSDALAASSMGTALRLQGEGQWLLALPTHYVAGAQVLIRSLFAGTAPEIMPGKFSVPGFIAAAANMTDPFRITSLVPTQLERLINAPEARSVLQRFNAILLGGAPSSPHLLETARALDLALVTTYGSAETCGGCVYDGVAIEGARVTVRPDQQGNSRVYLGGDTLADGYLLDAQRTASAFVELDSARWYRTDDLGELAADGTLRLLGRADDMVITGGLKVSAQHVTQQLERLDAVSAAFVAGVPDAEWGQAVHAAVVLVPGTDPAHLPELAATALDRHEVPKAFLPLSELPLLANGKIDRQLLTHWLECNPL